MNKKCPCGKQFWCPPREVNRKKYCCKKCFYKYRVIPIWNKVLKGIHLSPATEFKKGSLIGKEYRFEKGHKPKNPIKKGQRISPNSDLNKVLKGIHLSPATEFKKGSLIGKEYRFEKGHKPKNPIKKGQRISPNTEFLKGHKTWNKGKPHMIDDNHPQWKGGKVGYSALHTWIHRTWEKSKKCDFCGLEKRIDWANKNGIYNRNRINWLNLCRRCHIIYDKKNPKKLVSFVEY